MEDYDAIVIGSGFGGSMAAYPLVQAGRRVLMVERGDWVPRGEHNWAPEGSLDLTPYYSTEIPYRVLEGGNAPVMGAYTCVGGPSVFYGGVSMRLREADFEPDPDIVGDSGAAWPFRYDDLEPYYGAAERLIGVSGSGEGDPTEPWRSGPYDRELNALSATSALVGGAATALGLRPFRLPLAIDFRGGEGRRPCVACATCDTFACAIGAKNDLATRVIPHLLARGMELRPNTIAVRLEEEGGRVARVHLVSRETRERTTARARAVVLAAGALATPHLLRASALEALNPGGAVVGRYLTRHCNAIAFGFFPRPPGDVEEFHKQLGFHDFYFGHPTIETPAGKLGSMQQLQTPPVRLAQAMTPRIVHGLLRLAVPHLTGLLVMAEDQPRFENRVDIEADAVDDFGLPRLTITHRYTPRDLAARDALLSKARGILRRAGAWFCYFHKIRTFSHAVGTVRMGTDPETSALDRWCRFRGVENLWVTDGSVMPTSGGLNPSLTIAANALRVGGHLAGREELWR